MRVSITELRTEISLLTQMAHSGEEIIITHHKKDLAKIVPVGTYKSDLPANTEWVKKNMSSQEWMSLNSIFQKSHGLTKTQVEYRLKALLKQGIAETKNKRYRLVK